MDRRVKAEGVDESALELKKMWAAIESIRSARTGAIPHGSGSPEGVRHGKPGDTYIDDDGGPNATFWVKEEGTNTPEGWRAL